MTAIIGIDPGLTGALALYDGSDLELADMPVYQIGKKHVLDAYSLARLMDLWAPKGATAYVEFVASSPQMGIASSFKFGEGYGIIRGVLAANFIPVEFVTPAKWKATMKVKADKDHARQIACQAFPKHSALFGRKKDHNRAEAALIALYGYRENTRAAA